jgi:hypothetical protein
MVRITIFIWYADHTPSVNHMEQAIKLNILSNHARISLVHGRCLRRIGGWYCVGVKILPRPGNTGQSASVWVSSD